MTAVRAPAAAGGTSVAAAGGGTVPRRSLVLVGVELRKAVDTRAGRRLLVALAVLAAGADTVALVFGTAPDRAADTVLLLSQLPVGAVLPVLAIALATGEWTHRTALTTFALTPVRSRVVAAELAATVVLALLAAAASVAAAYAGHAVAVLAGVPAGGWGTAAVLGRSVLFLVVVAVAGAGCGLAVLHAAAAIVAFFGLPTLVAVVLSMIPGARAATGWVDLLGATTRLLGDPMPPLAWARLASAFAVWGLVPLAVGWRRVLRADVR